MTRTPIGDAAVATEKDNACSEPFIQSVTETSSCLVSMRRFGGSVAEVVKP